MSEELSGVSDTCRAAVFEAADRPLALRQFPMPVAGDDEAVVRIDCCTVCGSDLHTITGAREEPSPSILGHEIAGTVVSVGRPALADIHGRSLCVGDRVTWSVCVSCGECDRCARGLPQKCRSLFKYGHAVAEGRTALSGGLAEFILLRSGSAVVRVNESIPSEVICPANCATATVAAAFRAAGELTNRRVMIFGAGMLGLTAAAMAKSQHAREVVVCDQNAKRLERAKSFGADHAVLWHADAKTFRHRLSQHGCELFDVLLELSGSPDAIEVACELADVGAHVILVGTVMDTRSVSLDPQHIVRQWITVRGVHNYAPEDLQAAVEFLEQQHAAFPFAQLVQQAWPLADVNEAIQLAIREKPVRVAIHPGV